MKKPEAEDNKVNEEGSVASSLVRRSARVNKAKKEDNASSVVQRSARTKKGPEEETEPQEVGPGASLVV